MPSILPKHLRRNTEVNISDKLNSFICDVVTTPEFWRINYYLRSMKKAPHGGVFNNRYLRQSFRASLLARIVN